MLLLEPVLPELALGLVRELGLPGLVQELGPELALGLVLPVLLPVRKPFL